MSTAKPSSDPFPVLDGRVSNPIPPSDGRLDCIVIGHNDVDFGAVEAFMKKTRRQSAAYQDFKSNSVDLHGRRITYMQLLNEALQRATGRPYNLSVCELPHLGSCYLVSYLKARGFRAELVNFFNFDRQRLADLLAQSPRAVAITTTFYVSREPLMEVVEFVRQHSSETKIIVGGPHVLNMLSGLDDATQDYLFQTLGIDIYVTDSQGEGTLAQVLAELRRPRPDVATVPNLIYTDDGIIFERTRKEPEDNDLNTNTINWKLFDDSLYTPTVQMRTARSCAFSCAFCQYPALAGPLKLARLDVVERELQLLAEAGVRNLVFIDDTFNVPLPRFLDLCRMMIRNRFPFDWYSFFRCSNSNDEAFDLMQQSGCKGVFLGIESGDPQILKNMNKFAGVEAYRNGIGKLRERGILTFASIIVGFPGETSETVGNTIRLLEEACPTLYRCEIYYHYTNVSIHQRAQEFGLVGAGYSWRHNSMTWQEAADHVERIYKTVKGPVVLPGYMFDFWSVPYLAGKGFSLDQILEFLRAAQDLLIEGFGESTPDGDAHLDRMARLFPVSGAPSRSMQISV